MPTSQKKLSNLNSTKEKKEKMGRILDLESKYFDILWNLFTSDGFVNDLNVIEKEIQSQYYFLNKIWDLKNKLKVPAERLARQYIYKNLAYLVENIYPSPVSSDIAFITNDAIINIDIKTLDVESNKSDLSYLQFETNQSSFENKDFDIVENLPNSGIKVECLLPKTYSYNNGPQKPVLTYFLVIVYKDNGESFELSRANDKFSTIQLKCLPNGLLSELFNFDIIQNFKTYDYFKEKDDPAFKRYFLTKNKDELNFKVEEFVKNHPDYVLRKGSKKLGAFNPSLEHPYNGKYGISLLPVRDKNSGKYYLEFVKRGHTNRVKNEILFERFDSNDQPWDGIKKLSIL